MHNAPSVVYPVGRFVWASCLVIALAASVSCTVALCYGLAGGSFASMYWMALLCALTALCSACCLLIEWLHEGALVWDGGTWHCQAESVLEGPVQLNLVFDGGRYMLVSLQPLGLHGRHGLTRYACLRRSDMPSRWHGFRCAVYSRRSDRAKTA
jgi:hypothetical protein